MRSLALGSPDCRTLLLFLTASLQFAAARSRALWIFGLLLPDPPGLPGRGNAQVVFPHTSRSSMMRLDTSSYRFRILEVPIVYFPFYKPTRFVFQLDVLPRPFQHNLMVE